VVILLAAGCLCNWQWELQDRLQTSMKSSIKHFVFAPALILLLAAGGVESAKAAQADLILATNTSPDPFVQAITNLIDTCTCTYSFTVSNAGPAAATGVVVSNQIPYWVSAFISATGGSTPTNGILLMNLGPLAVGATSSVQVVVQCNEDSNATGVIWSSFTNVFRVYADQPDPDLTNNAAAIFFTITRTTTFTTSLRTIQTNLSSSVSQQATNYTTELIAVMPAGNALFDQSFNSVFSDPSVQAAVTEAAGDLTAAGATSYTGPKETSLLQSFLGTSSVSVTNPIGTNTSAATSLYIGPQTIMIGPDQSVPFFIPAGCMDYDTLITVQLTNLVTTTTTDTYLNSAVYMMTGIVAQADLSLSIAHIGNSAVVFWPNIGSYTLQQNSNLATGSWTTSGYSITTANGTNSITITPPVGNLFFRLRQ
jgi:uncharacterized repeat protein (TIGR01451 family)